MAEAAACFDAIAGVDPGRSLLAPGAARRSARHRRARPAHRVASPGGQSARRRRRCSPACEAAVRHLEGRGRARSRPWRRTSRPSSRPSWCSSRAGWPRASARTWRRSATRWRGACGSRSSGARGGRRWTGRTRSASGPPCTAACRRSSSASTSSCPRPSSRPPLAADHDPFEPISIGGETAGSIRGAWYPYMWPFNLSGHPAVSLPCGWSSDGLPIGLQIVGPWYADRRVLALAAHLERERPCARPMPL